MKRVVDEAWLELAGRNGWTVLLKDARNRSRTVEREALVRFRVRCFCTTRQDLTAAAMPERYLRHLDAIVKACREPGPFVYAVHESRIERLDLPS